MIAAAAGGAPVMAIIESLGGGECRVRSVNPFDIGLAVEFNVVVHGVPPIAVRGTILQRTANGPRFHYTIGLETSVEVRAALARAVEIAQSRAAARVPEVQTGNGLTRASIRVPVDFEVRYAGSGCSGTARATNLSTGGILMNCAQPLSVGTQLELRFLLGASPISVSGRIVAHQEASPNYNIAFFDVRDVVKETLARFVAGASAS